MSASFGMPTGWRATTSEYRLRTTAPGSLSTFGGLLRWASWPKAAVVANNRGMIHRKKGMILPPPPCKNHGVRTGGRPFESTGTLWSIRMNWRRVNYACASGAEALTLGYTSTYGLKPVPATHMFGTGCEPALPGRQKKQKVGREQRIENASHNTPPAGKMPALQKKRAADTEAIRRPKFF